MGERNKDPLRKTQTGLLTFILKHKTAYSRLRGHLIITMNLNKSVNIIQPFANNPKVMQQINKAD